MVDFKIEEITKSRGETKYKITKSKTVNEFDSIKTVSIKGKTLKLTKKEIETRIINLDSLKQKYENYLIEIKKISTL